ncbi:MAG: DUF2851 family protein [Dehalococcoidia bacterium]|nr:DUF2851 family protein [Dehalococcoidia bacterium]
MHPLPAAAGEAALAARWGTGLHAPLRLEDGRALKIIFPGIPAGGSGPDYREAIIEMDGDLVRGDVELHLRAESWRAHGHHLDPAYAAVVLHVVAENPGGACATLHATRRSIPILVMPSAPGAVFPPPFTPPCALASARGRDAAPVLERLGLRRLRMKAARAAPLAETKGPGHALYALLLETLGGPANREAFATLARTLPLAALLESAATALPGTPHPLALAAALKGVAASLVLRRAGLRPMASPGRRLEAAGELCASLWPREAQPAWPALLRPGKPLVRLLAAPGIGRGLAVECAVNAVLPAALASGAWTEPEAVAAWRTLPSPGTYGRLRRLEGWLGAGGVAPFAGASRLQGGLLLHADYCAKGACGRCPLSGES